MMIPESEDGIATVTIRSKRPEDMEEEVNKDH